MDEFRAFLTENQLSLPPGYDDASMLAFRYLEGSAYKNKDAYDAIMAHHLFLTTTYPL